MYAMRAYFLSYNSECWFCLFCSIGTNKYYKNNLKRHKNDNKHKAAVARYVCKQHHDSSDVLVAPLEACVMKSKYNMSSEKNNQLKVLFNFKQRILQAKNTLSVGENYTNIMGCRMFIKAISETMSQSVVKDMKKRKVLVISF